MEKRIKCGTALLIFLISALAIYGYFYHLSGDGSMTIRYADARVAAGELTTIAYNNEALFNHRYLYKVVSVRGIVRKLRKNNPGYTIFLGNNPFSQTSVSCTLDSIYNRLPPAVGVGDSCVLRGACAGCLRDVILLSCIIEKR